MPPPNRATGAISGAGRTVRYGVRDAVIAGSTPAHPTTTGVLVTSRYHQEITDTWDGMVEEKRICRVCNKEFPITSFELSNVVRGVSYRRHECSQCKTQRQRRRVVANRIWIDEYKRTKCCERCGTNDHRVLTFHHRDADEKEFTIADALRGGWSLDKIRGEIGKCSVLCANCHAIEHYTDPHERQISGAGLKDGSPGLEPG